MRFHRWSSSILPRAAAICVVLLHAPAAISQDLQSKIDSLIDSTWLVRVEGDVRTRTLRIQGAAVTERGGRKLQALYGWSDIGQSAVSAEINVADGAMTLLLTTQANSTLVAILQEPELFTGVFAPAAGQRRSVRLERVRAESVQLPEITTTEVSILGEGVTLAGTLMRPAVPNLALPAIVLLHGWGERWVNGAAQVSQQARQLAAAGYISLALSMRGWPKSDGYDDCGLEQPADVAKVVDWLAGQPGVDSSRIAVLGHSQGGQVALAAAARSRRIRAVVAYYPVTDIERWGRTTSHDGIRNYYVPRTCDFGKSRSPIFRAAEIVAPVLFLHGDADTRVPTEQSALMYESLKGLGRVTQLRIVKGAGHGFSQAQRAETLPVVLDFLARQMQVAK